MELQPNLRLGHVFGDVHCETFAFNMFVLL